MLATGGDGSTGVPSMTHPGYTMEKYTEFLQDDIYRVSGVIRDSPTSKFPLLYRILLMSGISGLVDLFTFCIARVFHDPPSVG